MHAMLLVYQAHGLGLPTTYCCSSFWMTLLNTLAAPERLGGSCMQGHQGHFNQHWSRSKQNSSRSSQTRLEDVVRRCPRLCLGLWRKPSPSQHPASSAAACMHSHLHHYICMQASSSILSRGHQGGPESCTYEGRTAPSAN